MSYCYYIASRIPSGVPRLVSVLPVCSLFLVFPLFLSSVHFSGSTAFFLSWLSNFKLILFAFDQGPLCPLPPNLSRFICLACFPIKPQQNSDSHQTRQHPSPTGSSDQISKWVFAIKIAFLCILLNLYAYREALPRIVVLILYSLHIYLELELLLALVKVLVITLLGCEIESQSKEPYLVTSLQDFRSRRWNLMVPAILRPSVHLPAWRAAERFVGPTWAPIPGIVAAFVVSGAVHELIFFYMTRLRPTWFFVLQGVCTAAEVAARRNATAEMRQMWRPSAAARRLMTMGLVVVTSGWLFFPQLVRSGMLERLADESLFFIDFVKRKIFV